MTNKIATLLGAAALVAATQAPAYALIAANGTFGFVPFGNVVADTGDITLATSTITYPDLVRVNTVKPTFGGHPNNLPVVVGDLVALSDPAFFFPTGLGTLGVDFDVTVHGITFSFDFARTNSRVQTGAHSSGDISAQYNGWLTNGNGVFFEDTPAILSIGCTQSQHTASVNCSNVASITALPVPEPATLALLGSALLGLWALLRRREPIGNVAA